MADIPKWPAGLPRPVSNGYGYQRKPSVARTEMDAGNTRSRRRFRTVPTWVSVTWAFTRQQLALFEAFVHYDLDDGAVSFETPLASSQGLSQVRAEFKDDPPYSVSLVASSLGLWTVSAQLKTTEMPVMSMFDYFPAYIGELNFMATADALSNAIHVVRPGASPE